MVVPGARRKTIDLAMPAWTPGSYLIRDFARHVYDLKAETLQGQAIPVTRIDKQTWRVEHDRQGFRVRYRVFADEVSVRTSHVGDRQAHLLGTSIFLYLVDDPGREAEVRIELPPGTEDWQVHTALPSTGPRSFHARDYDELVDSPLQLGPAQVETFQVDGISIDYVLTAVNGTNADSKRLADDAQKIVEAFSQMMGGLPFERYSFLVRAVPRGGGGLEHHNSTSMLVRQDAFDSDRAYQRAAHLAAHEFFHLWNVKRIHDVVLGPFDYRRESYTRLLWFHEGFTETMEAQAALRAGLETPRSYLENLADTWNRYLRSPGRNRIPVSQFSFEAWIEQYQPAANAPNVAVSYYRKGDLLGVALDLEIRLRAHARGASGSLAGVFRRLMESHAARGLGITGEDIANAASAEAGESMDWFFANHVDGTDEIPLLDALERIGVQAIADPEDEPFTGLWLAGATVRNVVPDSPADSAGFMRGDTVLTVGDRTVSDGTVDARIADHGVGDPVTITVDRNGRVVRLELQVSKSPHPRYVFQLAHDGEVDPKIRAVRDAWLGG